MGGLAESLGSSSAIELAHSGMLSYHGVPPMPCPSRRALTRCLAGVQVVLLPLFSFQNPELDKPTFL